MRGLAALLVLVGCSSPSPPATIPPVLDTLDVPTTATLDATGHAKLTGTVTFHDDDDNVVAMVLRLTKDGTESTGTIVPAYRWGKTTLNANFSGKPGMTVDYEVMVVDEAGHRSAPVARTLSLQ